MELKVVKHIKSKDHKLGNYYAMGGAIAQAAPNKKQDELSTPQSKPRAQSRGKRTYSISSGNNTSDQKKIKIRDSSPSTSYKQFKLMTSKKNLPPKSIQLKQNLLQLVTASMTPQHQPRAATTIEALSQKFDTLETQKVGTSVMLEPGESSRAKKQSTSPTVPKLKKKKIMLLQQQQSAQFDTLLQRFSQPQQKQKKQKKSLQPSQVETDVDPETEYMVPSQQQLIRQQKNEFLQEFRQIARTETQEIVKLAVAKILYLKRDVINEIKSQTPSVLTHAEKSQVHDYDFQNFKDRLERAEAEIAFLKDDQVSQTQVKKQLQDSASNFKELLVHQKESFKVQFEQFQNKVYQQIQSLKQQITLELGMMRQQHIDQQNQLKQSLLTDQEQHFKRFEHQKQSFLDSVQTNMKVLDNLVKEYSVKIKEQITKQLLQSQTSNLQQSRDANDSKGISLITDEFISDRLERSQAVKHSAAQQNQISELHHAVTERARSSFEMVEGRRQTRLEAIEERHLQSNKADFVGPDPAELSSKQSSLQKSDFRYEENKSEARDMSPIANNTLQRDTVSSHAVGGTGQIQLNDIGQIYLTRESQSMSLQQRREGAPNISATRNQKSFSNKTGTNKAEPTDSDFFNLTQEDQSQTGGLGLLDQMIIKQGSILIDDDVEFKAQVSPIPHKDKIQTLEPLSQKLSKKSLQRIANEIIEQLYVDEVIFALDEVINLAKDQIDTLIITQDQELTNIQRERLHYTEQLAQSSNNQAPQDQSDRYELSISAQDFIPDMSRSDDVIEENSLESGATSQQPEVTGIEVEENDLSRATDQDLEDLEPDRPEEQQV